MSRLSHYLASIVIVVVLVEEKSTTGYFSLGGWKPPILDNLPAASNVVGIWLNQKTPPYLR
ncbi:hypothetical protein IQ226_15325 [Dolichospermum sp. LEGE 00240]|uniref:hypothetical protein n=1 Tax=Dolichospermum sp. LEGE 00240 TaxID=1828603 RepID=UPI00187FE317|nr:hypothetical protein [Dolichospermum sp. LEGE 00240]MBE9250493.1 hypothetical protein [Dolichospermum sp. LEGE 00240]